jgi:hypothetical protein
MRPTFVDTVVAESGIRLEPDLSVDDRESREDREEHEDRVVTDEAYREWRRSRVVFMHPEADPYRQQEPGAVPAQRERPVS